MNQACISLAETGFSQASLTRRALIPTQMCSAEEDPMGSPWYGCEHLVAARENQSSRTEFGDEHPPAM